MRKKLFTGLLALIVFTVMMGGIGSHYAAAAGPAKWKMQTLWVPSITLWRGDKYLVDLLNVLAKDELEISYNEGGTLVTKSGEMFDAIRNGVIDMGTDWPSYWEGKNTAFSLFTSVPMFFTPADYLLWYWQGGGLELAQEIYGKFNIVWFPHSVTSPECGQRSNVQITKLADYKGVKMRQCGRNQAKILQDMGGAAIFLPGAEIYMALQRGTIDAGEFSVPECDWSMGFQEVTKYWILPGWHQPGPVSGVMINKRSYDKLPDITKFKIQQAAMATMMWAWTYFEYSSAEYTQKFLKAGTKISKLDEEALKRIQKLSFQYLLEDAKANPDHAKVAFSMTKFLKDFAPWRDYQYPFMFGRNPWGLDEVYAELEALVKKNGDYDKVIKLERDVRKRAEAQVFWKPGTKYVQNPLAQ
jgi:TRAP-type mannitol/chloroaromatic compound transport system substrate-binding protein